MTTPAHARRAWFVIIAALGVVAHLAAPARAEPTYVSRGADGLALSGYDPVAYFTEGKAEKGRLDLWTSWEGAVWRFSKPEHREAFMHDPERYAPQFGGYSAFELATRGELQPGHPSYWRIVSGRLFVNRDRASHYLWQQTSSEFDPGRRPKLARCPRHVLPGRALAMLPSRLARCIMPAALSAITAAMMLTASVGATQLLDWRREWPRTDFSKHLIDLAEVKSGGPPKDGISAIDRPRFRG